MFVPRKPSSFATYVGAWRMFNEEPSIILSLYKERWAYGITMLMYSSVHVAIPTITSEPSNTFLVQYRLFHLFTFEFSTISKTHMVIMETLVPHNVWF
jgi:hypothetical protein